MLENIIKCKQCGREHKAYIMELCRVCYKRKWDKDNEQHRREYQRQWSRKNKDKVLFYNQQQRAKRQGYYLYIFKDYLGLPLYIGASTDIKQRLYNHLHYNSHLKYHLSQGEWDVVEVANLTGLLYNLEELRFIENYLIELYEPSYNQQLNNIQHIDSDRVTELIDIAEELIFVEYAYNDNLKNEYKKNMLY